MNGILEIWLVESSVGQVTDKHRFSKTLPISQINDLESNIMTQSFIDCEGRLLIGELAITRKPD